MSGLRAEGGILRCAGLRGAASVAASKTVRRTDSEAPRAWRRSSGLPSRDGSDPLGFMRCRAGECSGELLCSCWLGRCELVRTAGCGGSSGVASFVLQLRTVFRSLEEGNLGGRHGGESRSECPGGAGKPTRGAVSLHRPAARGAQEHRVVVERHAGSDRARRVATRSPDTLKGTGTP